MGALLSRFRVQPRLTARRSRFARSIKLASLAHLKKSKKIEKIEKSTKSKFSTFLAKMSPNFVKMSKNSKLTLMRWKSPTKKIFWDFFRKKTFYAILLFFYSCQPSSFALPTRLNFRSEIRSIVILEKSHKTSSSSSSSFFSAVAYS